MAESNLFDEVCAALERATNLDTLASRGTIRLALKSAGLEPRTLDKAQMQVVLDRVLPGELRSRGVDRPDEVCASIAKALTAVAQSGKKGSSPEEIFRRLGG